MANVIVDKTKLDYLANAISAKSGEPLTLTLDEMVDAVDGIETGGGGITPTGNIDITQAGVTDVTNYATATVPSSEVNIWADDRFYTQNGIRKWEVIFGADVLQDGWTTAIDDNESLYNAVSANTTITPTESSQTIGGANYMMEGAVTVNAIPSNYVGSGITQRTSSDLTASGATVSVPSGYYASNASKAVASGTEGTPTATKGTVTNHSVTVTPNVTNTAGYISGGTHSGTAVSVSASELVSGTYTVSSSGTANVTNYASISVASGSATPASSISGTSATVSTGTNTLTLSKTVSNTPQVSAGYVSSGTAGNSSVSLTANVTTKAAATIYPSASDQSIASGTYLTGAQTIKGVTYSNLTADNIKNGVTVTVGDSADADRILSITGTYEGGGGGTLTVKTATTTKTSTGQTISFSSLSGTPKYWFLRATTNVSSSGSTTYYYITDLFYDGTNIKGNTFRIGSTRRVQNITSGVTQSYSGNTLTITAGSSSTATPGQFYGASNFGYELVYIY